jgi:hypothetical protein
MGRPKRQWELEVNKNMVLTQENSVISRTLHPVGAVAQL